jgi:hypothetical protein
MLSNCPKDPQCTIKIAVSPAANAARRTHQGTTGCEKQYTPQETASQTMAAHINKHCVFLNIFKQQLEGLL